MTKKELVNEIAGYTGFTKKDCMLFVDVFCNVISKALEHGERVKIANFGVFEVKEYKARTGNNFVKNTTCLIPPKKVPSFTAGEGLKQAIGGVGNDGC